MKSVIPVAVGMLVLSGLSAQAGWQYTKWGMTPEQVEKASRQIAVPVTRDPQYGNTVKLSAPYSTGSFKFNVEFGFNQDNRLVFVSLDLIDGNRHELIGALRGRYGKTVNETRDPLVDSYMWKSSDDQIALMTNSEKTNLFYSRAMQQMKKAFKVWRISALAVVKLTTSIAIPLCYATVANAAPTWAYDDELKLRSYLPEMHQALNDRLNDYPTARFQSVSGHFLIRYADKKKEYAVCGMINLKNKTGGYDGWQYFVVMKDAITGKIDIEITPSDSDIRSENDIFDAIKGKQAFQWVDLYCAKPNENRADNELEDYSGEIADNSKNRGR